MGGYINAAHSHCACRKTPICIFILSRKPSEIHSVKIIVIHGDKLVIACLF